MAYKILRGCMYLILYLLFIIGLSWLLFRFDDAVNLITGNYPAIGYYYISFEKGDENIISNIYYKQHIYNEPIDLSNLMLYAEENTSYCLDRKSNIYNDETIRIFLLENGLAELKNIDKALESEIKAQEKAVKKKTGIWEINSNTKVVTLHSIFNVIFATVYKGNIIKNLIMDCQSYTKYRPNETTGGIFVSWRRKEELPTGA